MPPVKTTTRLADLSERDRAQLRAELVAEQAALAAAERDQLDAAAGARTLATARLLDMRAHVRGCPDETPSTTSRIEAYGATKPAIPDKAIPAKDVTVVRCITCGGDTVLDKPYTDTLAEITATISDIEE